MEYVKPVKQFAKDSMRLVKRCTKPDMKGKTYLAYTYVMVVLLPSLSISFFSLPDSLLEFQRIALATAVGFAVMGFIGFFVKLIHIPINNIIV